MTAVIGTPVTDLLQLLPGIRIAKVLWELKNEFFDFFRENGTFDLGLKSAPNSPSLSADSRYLVWVKITQSLDAYCRSKVDKLEKSASHFDELRDSRVNLDSVSLFTPDFLSSLVRDEDRDSMEYFCVTFVLFIKTEFATSWKAIESRMEPDLLRNFEDYLQRFGKSINKSRRESVESKIHASPKYSEYKLLNEIDSKCEQIRNLQSEVIDLKRNQQSIKDDNTKLRHQIAYLQDSLIDKKNQISVLNERCA